MSIFSQNSKSKLVVDCQGRAFYVDNLYQDILAACGSSISKAYFEMIEMDISEVLYHLNIFVELYKKQHPESRPESKVQKWGLQDVDFEPI